MITHTNDYLNVLNTDDDDKLWRNFYIQRHSETRGFVIMIKPSLSNHVYFYCNFGKFYEFNYDNKYPKIFKNDKDISGEFIIRPCFISRKDLIVKYCARACEPVPTDYYNAKKLKQQAPEQ